MDAHTRRLLAPNDIDKLEAAVKRFRNADTEFRRAKSADDGNRLNRAGTAYATAKYRLFKAAGLERKR